MLTTYVKNGTFGIIYPSSNGMNKTNTIRNKTRDAQKMSLLNKNVAKALGYQPRAKQ